MSSSVIICHNTIPVCQCAFGWAKRIQTNSILNGAMLHQLSMIYGWDGGLFLIHISLYRCLSGKLWYLQHSGVGDTIVYHSDSDKFYLCHVYWALKFSPDCRTSKNSVSPVWTHFYWPRLRIVIVAVSGTRWNQKVKSLLKRLMYVIQPLARYYEVRSIVYWPWMVWEICEPIQNTGPGSPQGICELGGP